MDMASPPISSSSSSSSHSGFPIIAAAIISILATAFLLVSYYVSVIKCCLDWDRDNFLRPFSISRRQRAEDPLLIHSTAVENGQGLDEYVIRSIPIFQYKKISEGSNATCECAVCLNEYQEDENLRVIPHCAHVFHIDCIDIWLQNNANCPLYRASISSSDITARFPLDQIINPQDEDYVVIEIARVQERLNSEDLSSGHFSISPSPRKIEPKVTKTKVKKFSHVSSMGDECSDIRKNDEEFTIQPIRRSFSMDSSADRQLYLVVQDIMQHQRQVHNVSSSEGTSSRVKRSFFSFGHGRGLRNEVLPLHLEP